MADRFGSEEEWSESEFFDEPNNPLARRPQLDDGSYPQHEVLNVSPAPPLRTVSALRPSIKLSAEHSAASDGPVVEEGSSEASRSPLDIPRSNPPSPGAAHGQKRGFAFGTPEHTPRADKAQQEFPPPMASCPVAISHFGKKQHVAEQPPALENLPSPTEHAFMPPHELLAQTLPEYDADVARLGFRPGSVMEGVGRKLQGRDAVRFRRAIMRQTGFLENQSPLTEEARLGQSVPG